MSTNSVTINLVVKDGNSSAVVTKFQSELRKLGSAAQDASRAGTSVGSGFHASVSGMQAASAAIRELNGDFTNNIRAVERFVTMVPGVAPALKGLFPLVGGIAFGAMLVEVGIKIVEFQKQMAMLPRAIQEGFAALILSAETSTDELNRRTDETRGRINTLLGKPPSNQALLAIDDTRIAADHLASSAANATRQVADLLKQHGVSALQSIGSLLLPGQTQGGTADAAGTANYYLMDLQDKAFAAQQAYHRGDKAAGDKLTAMYQARRKEAVQALSANAQNRKANPTQFVGNQMPSIAILQGTASILTDQMDAETSQSANTKADETLRRLQQQREIAARDQTSRMRQVQTALAASRMSQPVFSIKPQEIKFDDLIARRDQIGGYLNAFPKGSEQSDELNRMYQQQSSAAQSFVSREFAERRARENAEFEEMLRMSNLGESMSRTQAQDVMHTGSRYSAFNRSQMQGAFQPQEAGYALGEYQLRASQLSGQISRYDAAQEQATLHAREFAVALGKLNAEMNQIASDKDLDEAARQTQLQGLGLQKDQLTASRAVQIAEDNSAIDDTQVGTQIRNALNLYVQEATDAGKQIGQVLTSSFSSVNQTLGATLTDYYHTSRERLRALRTGLGSDVRGAGAGLINSSLQNLEGTGLKALGFGGKPDGSANNPLYVRMAGGVGSAAGLVGNGVTSALGRAAGGIGGLFSRLFGGVGSSSESSSLVSPAYNDGSYFGTGASATDSAIKALFPFQGFFASGGDVVANRPAIIGEKGPEMFVPQSAGMIIPNDQLASMGGDVHHHWNIDARGSTDPAQTYVMAQRAIKEAAPQIIAASRAYGIAQNKRLPAARRS